MLIEKAITNLATGPVLRLVMANGKMRMEWTGYVDEYGRVRRIGPMIGPVTPIDGRS